MRHLIRPWLVIGLLALALAPAASQETIARPQGTAATVNGQAIPEVAVQRALRRVPEDRHAQARVEIVNYLIDNVVIDQYLEKLPNPVTKKDLEDRLDQIRAEIRKAGQDYEKVLKELLITEEELRTQLAADMRWEKYATDQATDQALQDLFRKHKATFDGSTVRARHILLSPEAGNAKADQEAKAQLQQVRRQIEDEVTRGLAKLPPNTDDEKRQEERTRLLTEVFAARAKDISACPSKDKGGDIGFFPRSGAMVEPFARAAFELQPNQLSDVVTTQFGHHLILVTETRPGQEVKYDDVKDAVRGAFFEKLRENLAAQLRQKATIVISPK
jgi:parvulin-like peptidyl-prolyl isomerase